jgi:hypothetical protein
MSGDDASYSNFGLYVRADSRVTCHHYPGKNPILAIDTGASSLLISVAGRDASDSVIEFTRDLVRSVQEFATDMERLHAAQHADARSTEGAPAATDKAAEGKAA